MMKRCSLQHQSGPTTPPLDGAAAVYRWFNEIRTDPVLTLAQTEEKWMDGGGRVRVEAVLQYPPIEFTVGLQTAMFLWSD